ncbi:TIGR03619 family F420-dependent LLM class oxidoreductase, partial [Minwuia thermotolerans]|uniref:TIGR03619 family F420-dependent LLM class oxidoreductase n=1 Tax=Minwuia thermotolerans TaxID=2056226 RepID=UPI000F63161C
MRLGVVFPQIEIAGDAEAVRRIVLAAEELEYDYILAYDHVVKAVHADRVPELEGPYTENDPFHDPFVLFGYAAGITKRIEFTTGVLILPQRQTVLVAQQAADVDILSGGRLRLGVGIGWNYVEYDALGENFRTRGRRADEQIGFLRRLWEEPVVSFDGRFDRIDRAGINPRPKRSIPIWIGGVSEPA